MVYQRVLFEAHISLANTPVSVIRLSIGTCNGIDNVAEIVRSHFFNVAGVHIATTLHDGNYRFLVSKRAKHIVLA